MKQGRDRGILDEFLEAEWPQMRKEGREAFIWKHRVLPFGLPIAVLGIIWFFYLDGLGPKDLFTLRGMALSYMVLGFFIIGFYVFGRLEWTEREDRYRRQQEPK